MKFQAKSNNKILYKFFAGAIIFIISITLINAFTGNKIINGIYSIAKKIEETGGIQNDRKLSFDVYDNAEIFDDDPDTNNIKLLVSFQNDGGIDYVEKEDGTRINSYGNKNLSIDLVMEIGKTENFKIKYKNGGVEEKSLTITQEDINELCQIEIIEDENDKKINKITFNTQIEPEKNIIELEMTYGMNIHLMS